MNLTCNVLSSRGVQAIADLAAMRDAVDSLGSNPQKIHPVCPVDLVVDQSTQIDIARKYESTYDMRFALVFDTFLFFKLTEMNH